MPRVDISLREHTTDDARRRAISDAIHKSMIDVLGIPEDDRFHTFHVQGPGTMLYEPVVFGIERSERCMFIQLVFNHRTPEQKQALFAAIVENLGNDAGVRSDELMLYVVETAGENWWAEGRVVDPDTGYDERMTDTVRDA